jgi:dienelactone hydrolase
MRGTAAWAVLALGLAACGGDDKGSDAPDEQMDAGLPDAGGGESCETATALTEAELLARGPHEAALIDLPLVDESRTTAANGSEPEMPTRSLPTKVWFPAAAGGGLAAGGPFPLIVWGHGLASSNAEATWLAEHLASHGYVFAAPQHPLGNLSTPEPARDLTNTPGDFSFVIDTLLAKSAAAGDTLEGAIDAERIVAGGYSNGAATATIATFHAELRDARVKALVAVALAGGFYGPELLASREVPWLEVHGELDAFSPVDPHATTLRTNASAPFWQALIPKGTHTGFSQVGQTLAQPDRLGCSFDEQRGDPVIDYEALGGTEAGFVLPPPPLPEGAITCADTDPLPESLTGKQQTDIARQVITAFLAMHVGPPGERASACAYLAAKVSAPDDSFTLFER